MNILKNVSLLGYNTFGIDSKADLFCMPAVESEISEIIDSGLFSVNNHFVIGVGSNVLFLEDFHGFILHPKLKSIKIIKHEEDFVIIEAGAGVIWHDFTRICLNNKWYGIENLALIPGTVGAAPVQNIGAYGVEQKDFFDSLSGILIDENRKIELSKLDCKFGYRDSIFKNELYGKIIITSVRYKLSRISPVNLKYKELADEITQSGIIKPTPKNIFDTVCSLRGKKLPDPRILPNAGSFFKNPVIPLNQYEQIKSKYKGIFHILEDGSVKLSAAGLIEQCGWKGYRKGDAGVFDRHALILVNHGKATGMDIFNLAKAVRTSVFDEFGIRLQFEVNVISKVPLLSEL